MGDYISPIQILNQTNNAYDLKNEEDAIENNTLPPLNQIICFEDSNKSQEIDDEANRKPNYLKDTYITANGKSRLPAIRNYLAKLDNKEQRLSISEGIEKYFLKLPKLVVREKYETKFNYILRERENFRQNFGLKQMRKEIQRMKDVIVAEEIRLENRAKDLEADAVSFNEFIKMTDAEAAEAIKFAEEEKAAYNDRKTDASRLANQILMMRSQLSRNDEKLCEYFSYKQLLLLVKHNISCKPHALLTTVDWEQQKIKSKQQPELLYPEDKSTTKNTSLLQVAPTSCVSNKMIRKPSDKVLVKHSTRAKHSVAPFSQNRTFEKQKDKFRMNCIAAESIPPNIPEIVETSNVLKFLYDEAASSKNRFADEWKERDALTIKNETKKLQPILDNSNWLIEVYHDLEEKNIQLITHFQMTDEAQELLQIKFENTRKNFDKELSYINQQCEKLQANIEEYENLVEDLQIKCSFFQTLDRETRHNKLGKISKRIENIYVGIFGVLVVQIESVAMLTRIEEICQTYLEIIEEFPEETVLKMFRRLEKERRHLLREKEMEKERKRFEERSKKSNARFLDATKKIKCRRLISRSKPIYKSSDSKKKTFEVDAEFSYYFEK